MAVEEKVTLRELRRLLEALKAVKEGDFSIRLPARPDGLLGEIEATFNDVLEVNARMAKELARVSRVIGREGRMTERASLGAAGGAWGASINAVNSLIDDLVRSTTEVARVIDAVADGDLSQKMALKIEGQPVKGKFLRIGTTVNSMVDQLSSFAAEVTRVAREVGTEGKLGCQAKVKGVSGVWKDLTDNVNTLAGNLAARVLASIGDGVFLLDCKGVIRIFNPAAEAITGLQAGKVIGRPAEKVIPGWAAVAPLVPVATGPGPPGIRPETVPLEVGGQELWLSISGVAVEDGTAYAFRDLTEERAVELLKSEFVATVSHELRTPLAAIYGAAVTLRRKDLDLDAALREPLLDVIGEESERLAQIIDHVLVASHLDSGGLQVRIESCDALELVRVAIDAAEVHRPEGISIQLVAPEKLPQVAADPGSLRQVLANLLDNAINYSPDGGPVEVKLERVAGHLRFSIRDEGLGIPPREQERIFEKFYRLDPNLTRGVGGTGLGLYICRELVRRMDGRIWVNSTEGEGSTFFVDLPLASTRLDLAASAQAQPASSV